VRKVVLKAELWENLMVEWLVEQMGSYLVVLKVLHSVDHLVVMRAVQRVDLWDVKKAVWMVVM
jgi:hypothetical protein